MNVTAKVLIVDDEAPLMQAICAALESRGFETSGFTSAPKALEKLREESFDLILTDLMMPAMDGISVLNAAFEIDPNLAGIVMTGHSSVDTAVNALKAGAFDYITKPFHLNTVMPVIMRALTSRRLRMENIQLRETVSLHELSVAIALAQDSGTVLEKVADAAVAHSHTRAVWVLLVEDNELRLAAVRGEGTPLLENLRIPLTAEILGWAEQTESTVMPAASALPDGLSIPMLAGGRLTGVVHFERPPRTGQFTPGELRALHILAGTGASALAAVSALEKLRSTEERYRRLAEEAPDIVWRAEVRPRPATTYVNPAILTATGYTPEEFYADPALALRIVHPEERDIVERVLAGRDAEAVSITVRWVSKAGKEIWVEQRNRFTRDAQGNVQAIEAVSRDITERKTLEDRLRHSQRLEAVGKLTAGIAHDFNNLLTVINGFSALAVQTLEPGSQTWSRIREVQQAGEQAAGVTAQLLAFSRKQVLRPRAVNLNSVLSTLEQMIQSTAGASVKVDMMPSSSDSWIKIDPVQMQQVLMNLTVNARDAMAEGGRLTFEVQNYSVDEARAAEIGIRPGRFALLKVADTGCGMPQEVIERVFEPFYTTKEMGRGTGLGLATVHGIMEQSGGHIQIASQPGAGTTFSLWFPRCDAVTEVETQETSEAAAGNETILLVEDEPAVRRFAEMVLCEAGYQVLTAHNGESAIELAQTHAGDLSLLITDVCLGSEDGFEVAKRIAEICPAIETLFVSGFTDSVPEDEPANFLHKPYTPAELCDRARQILNSVCAV